MRVGPFNLYKAFATNRLIAASSVVQVRRIVQEADWALAALFINEDLQRLPVDEGVVRQIDFTWSQVAARAVA